MSKLIDDGGPAFPIPATSFESHGETSYYAPEPGMSLRDWFAGQALPSLLRFNVNAKGDDTVTRRLFAEEAYALSDAMLDARKK